VGAFNGRYFGGTFTPAKSAVPDDGLLDFVLFGGINRFETAKALKDFSSGELNNFDGKFKIVRGKKMKIMQKWSLYKIKFWIVL